MRGALRSSDLNRGNMSATPERIAPPSLLRRATVIFPQRKLLRKLLASRECVSNSVLDLQIHSLAAPLHPHQSASKNVAGDD